LIPAFLLCRGGIIRVIEVNAVPEKALVAEAGGMGAPTVGIEKLDAYECEAALRGHFKGGKLLLVPELYFNMLHWMPLVQSCFVCLNRHGMSPVWSGKRPAQVGL